MKSPSCIDAVLAHHRVAAEWHELPATGVANRIIATRTVVLRIATNHPEAIPDARTESVAAPVARAAGILVPELIAFDDSCTLLDRPYSIWERIHGETLGIWAPDPRAVPQTWRAVGRELARLHDRVCDCPDPNGWLDNPDRDMDLAERLRKLVEASRVDPATAATLARWIEQLAPDMSAPIPHRFIHNDLHDMNIMCGRDGDLLGLIDWGDAGWGDPMLDLSPMPLAAVPFVLGGYRDEAQPLDEHAEARIVWDGIRSAIRSLEKDARGRLALEDLTTLIRATRLASLV